MVRVSMPDTYDLKPPASRIVIGSEHSLGIELVAIPRPFSVKIGRLNGLMHPDPTFDRFPNEDPTGLVRIARLHVHLDALKECLGDLDRRHGINSILFY